MILFEEKGVFMLDIFKKYITVKNIIFFIISILAIIFITKIKDIAILFFASYVIACSLNPIADRLEKKMPRSAAAGIVLLGALGILLAFVVPIFVMGGHQIHSFMGTLPERLASAKNFIFSLPYLNTTDLKHMDLSSLIASAFGATGNVVSTSISFSKEIASGIIYSLASCLIIYYFIADKDVVRKGYTNLFPKQMKERAEDILETISQKIGGYVLAQVVTMVSVGVIVFLGLLILRVDYALLLGLITAVFDLVPVIGPTLALIVMIIAVAKHGIVIVGLTILVFAIAQWAENNLVRPYIFSKIFNLHPLIIYFFLFVTAQYLGIIGVVFAPAIAATVCVLIEELYIKSIN